MRNVCEGKDLGFGGVWEEGEKEEKQEKQEGEERKGASRNS